MIVDIELELEELEQNFDMSLEDNVVIEGIINCKEYDGAYEVIPSREKQTLPTSERLMIQDVIVQPIPKEYSRVSYDRNTKTLSIR